MFTPRELLYQEIDRRVERTRGKMEKRGYDALVIYGDNKVNGSLRYLTDYFPDRAGWISLGARETYLFEGAALFLPLKGDPVLLLEPGLMPTRKVHVKTILAGGFSVKKGEGLSGQTIVHLMKEGKATIKLGIETWSRFPALIYLELRELMTNAKIKHSTIVEESRMIKTPLEIEILKRAAAVGDLGSQAALRMLSHGAGRTELEVIRAAEHAMRMEDTIYEDSCTGSPSLINSGTAVSGSQLHFPDPEKKIGKGDAVHWDICLRYDGYAIDTSRTRVMGKATDQQKRAYETTLRMQEAVFKAAKPGVPASELVILADKIARESGFQLWDCFLGHGLGMETHERPDMGLEETRLATNMVLAIEPRVTDGCYFYGIEDMTLITEDAGIPLTGFDKQTLEIMT